MIKRIPRIWRVAVCLLALGACARPYTITVSPAEPGATLQTVFVATQQRVSPTGDITYDDRPEAAAFAQIAVAIPPDHVIGEIENIYDPSRGFTMPRYTPQDRDTFIAALDAGPGDEILIYVHGYNTTTTEAVFRFAQMSHDFGFENTTAVFSWASAGVPAGYVYDRDSVLFARDDLAGLLADISRFSNKSITIIAHSLGSQLIMETMRQLAIAGKTSVLDDIGTVVLFSPDIDPDIFRRQVATIGARRNPYIMLTNSADQALGMSSLLVGGRTKLGQLAESDAIADLDVVIIDLTQMSSLAHLGHMVAATSPSAIRLLRQISETGDLATLDAGLQ
ncbi:Esterase/lipase superfamily enzyme [Yoonia tamlensis]|uniref:Esterase/lipase superfamily enzyme n=1 Tax=Yoonia tamlensis TaxID=390270 RepID=A0A1I6GMM3_9RHOB|nr:alpha/beta hydrolase [Yoonia tamlensis]SFR43440.1 Esterase/lipase superfamily enzyme [Yoonia tamlensis]